jgi:glycine cleavage system pyridoxal-binding protein P
MMAFNVTGKRIVLVSQGVHPHHRQVLKTYLSDLPAEYREIPLKNGLTDSQFIEAELEPIRPRSSCSRRIFWGTSSTCKRW